MIKKGKTSSKTLPVPVKMHLPVFASNKDSAPKPSVLLPCLLPTQAAVFSDEWFGTLYMSSNSTYPTNSCLAAESLMLADDKLSHIVYRCCISFIIASGARLGKKLTRFWNRVAHTGNTKSFQQKSKRIDKLLAPVSAPCSVSVHLSFQKKKKSPERGEKRQWKPRSLPPFLHGGSRDQGLRVISTPGVDFAAAGGAFFHVHLKGELCLALAGCGRVLHQELHDVWAFLVAAEVASVDDVHDAGQHVCSAAAEANRGVSPTRLLLLTPVQHLQRHRKHAKSTKTHLLQRLVFLLSLLFIINTKI